MTTLLVDDVTPRVYYVATAAQTVFDVPFIFFENSDLQVYVNDTLKTLTTDYTVAGAGSNDDTVRKITFTSGLTLNDRVAIIRDVAAARTTLFPSSGPLNISSLNTQINKIFAILQQWESLLARTLKLNDADSASSLNIPSASARANKALAFDANGDPVASASVIGTTVTAFMQTVLDDATAAAARTTLGALSNPAAISDITGLTAALAGKTDTGHTHTAANVTDFATAVAALATGAIGIQAFTSGSGTYTKTAGTKKILAIGVGGGGGGGAGGDTAGGTGAAGGGGAGACFISFVDMTSTSTLAYSIGTAGTAGVRSSSPPTAGGNGGATTLGAAGANGSAGGGVGSASSNAAAQTDGGAGGTSSNGTVNIAGGRGGHGASLVTGINSMGGVSFFGGTGAPGAGGRGGSNAAGGAGSAGILIIFEFA